METAQIISTITSQLGETPLSARSISDYVNANLPAEGTEPTQEYFDGIVNNLKLFGTMYSGQHNHEMSETRKNWETEWEKTHPQTPNNPPVQTPPAAQQQPTAMTREDVANIVAEALKNHQPQADPQIATMQQQMQQMQQQMTERENAAKINSIKESVMQTILDMPNVNEGILNLAIQQSAITADTKVEDAIKSVKESYENINKSIFGNSAKPLGGGQGENSSGVAEYLKSLKEKDEQNAKARAEAAAQYK